MKESIGFRAGCSICNKRLGVEREVADREAEESALLIVDRASLDDTGILALQTLRDDGWNGKLITLGDVSRPLLVR